MCEVFAAAQQVDFFAKDKCTFMLGYALLHAVLICNRVTFERYPVCWASVAVMCFGLDLIVIWEVQVVT